jgi:hypothetical protein
MLLGSISIGLSPLLQWMVIPTFAFLCAHRAVDPSFKMLRCTHRDLGLNRGTVVSISRSGEAHVERTQVVKRMPIIRLILATLVSIGLVLSPVTVANAMAATPPTLADQFVGTDTAPMDGDCLCCDMSAACAAAICGMSCAQLGPAPEGL